MASGNVGKLREIARLLADLDIAVIPQSELGVSEADETGTTFVENALLKARHAAHLTGLPAIADDSGLAVDALGGRPGVYSARYSGPEADPEKNIDRLLAELDGVPAGQRGAAFHCVACFVMDENAEPIIAEGEWRGEILHARQGSGGFGYDPVFFDPELACSSAELGAEQKDARSHRGKALRALVRQLRDYAWPQN
jgi:XTP/dITP diphosphohydrolase